MPRDTLHNLSSQQAAQQAEALLRAGQPERAIALLRSQMPRTNSDPKLLAQLGSAELQAGMVDDAHEHLSRAVALGAAGPITHLELARACTLLGHHDQAERALDRASELAPDLAIARAMRGDLLATLGRADEAAALTNDLLDEGVPDPSSATIVASLARSIGRHDDALALLERFILDPRFETHPVPEILFRMGDLLDDLKRHDEAFAAYERANRAVGSRFDPIAHARAVDAMLDAWTPQAIARMVRPASDAPGPIFIVGMPRSGTSLVEQILSCCDGLTPGGERPELRRIAGELSLAGAPTGFALVTEPGCLSRQAIGRLHRRLMRAYDAVTDNEGLLTDKLPENALHLGLIWALLPGARVIVCERDPMDVGWSCYKQLFSGVMPWAQDLGHIASYRRDLRRTLDHWQQLLDLPMLTVRYEDLVTDQEAQTRQLVAFTGLGWTDAALRPHESEHITRTVSRDQVRQPIHRGGIGRYRPYEAHLGLLRDGLAD